MSTILVIDDRRTNRELLVQLLSYRGHRMLEAIDGAEGLTLARTERPDLAIADIVMPTMDGYEFVHRLRGDPATERIPVIFYTAHFLEPEARGLARACGVSYIITKPSEPEAILRTVDAALAQDTTAASAPPRTEFDREHVRVISDKLSTKVDELQRTNQRLTALIELCQQLASERDPASMLATFCRTAREIVGARYAIVGILPEGGRALEHFVASGTDAATAAALGAMTPRAGILGRMLDERRSQRLRPHSVQLQDAGLPPFPSPVYSFLGAPIVSLEKVYGWLCLADKLGASEFGAEDEALATALAAQVGRMYENGRLYDAARRHATELEQEVAERQRAEAALRESQRFAQRMADASPNIVYVYDLEQQVTVYCNRDMATLLGYSDEEIRRMSPAFFQKIMDPDDFAALSQQHAVMSARDGDVVSLEVRLKHRDGRWRWFHSNNVVFSRTPEGMPTQILGAAQDITDQKQAEARLRKLERLAHQRERLADIGTITATLLHDLRSPLGNIALQAFLLLDAATHAGSSGPEITETAQHIASEARRIEHLVSEIMSVSRERRLDRKPIDLRPFLREVLRPWYPAAQERHITLHLNCSDYVPTLVADGEELHRALDNLIRNALEAIEQGPGSVEIAVTVPERGYVRISVRDTGPGVPAHVHVFHIFETTKPDGSGLGLVAVRQVVLAHGGAIRYENLQPHGAVFHMELPCDSGSLP